MDKEYKGLGLIHDYLVGIGARGEEKRCPAINLTKAVGAADTRQLQEWIAAERDPRDPILASSRGGYFLRAHGLQGRCELVKNRKTVHKRGVHTLSLSSLLDKAIALWDLEHGGQMEMEDMGTEGKNV